MSAPAANDYDEVPYGSFTHAQSHPDRLAVVATLLGLRPPPVERCRVLELGCESGGNLLPMAQTLPESTFVGVELSARQAAEGRQVAADLGLRNVELRQMSILDIGPDLGRFDYIVAHGVYSWVSPPVQDRILHICAEHLDPSGIAYVSYNTYPGWHLRGIIRELMRYRARRFPAPRDRIAPAREVIALLARSVPADHSPYSLLLQSGVELLRHSRDEHLFHEYLEECNDPVYFHQFVERAEDRGLRYLGEAELAEMLPRNFSPQVQQVLGQISSGAVEMEQYMDFLRNSTFRQTLLCHRDVLPSSNLDPGRLTGLHVASPVRSASPGLDVASSVAAKFQGPENTTLSVTGPLLKAAMVVLSEAWPGTLPFAELCSRARIRLGVPRLNDPAAATVDAQLLAADLLAIYTSMTCSRCVELTPRPLRLAARPGERPRATPLARWQATAGTSAANLRHQNVPLGKLHRQVLRCLDGAHDRAALVEATAALVAQGAFVIRRQNESVSEPEAVRQVLRHDIEVALNELAASSFLME